MIDVNNLSAQEYDRWLSNSEKAVRTVLTAANDAFTAAMNKQIAKGRENARPGTFVDLTPPIGVLRPRGTYPMSGCGSPAAMCMESGYHQAGAESMK